MIKKSIIAVIAIVAAAAIIFAAVGGAGNNNFSNQQQLSVSNNSSTSDNNSNQNIISSEEAKKIAQKYIEEPGATAGTPTLNKTDGQYVYTVPVMENGKNVGEIDIDAQTGKNVGGAGGAP